MTAPLRRPLVTTLLASTVTALLAAGCGSTQADSASAPTAARATITVADAQGRSVKVPEKPVKVVATDWSVIRTLHDLGVEVAAVPKPTSGLPSDLADYAKKPHVGTVFEPDYEAIAAMQPDLVIVGSRSGNAKVVKEFEKFAPAVIDMSVRSKSPKDTFAETRERVSQLGSIFGKKQQADQLMSDVAAEVSATKAEVAKTGRTAMVVQVSDGTVSAYGPGSRFGTVYQDFGYRPTAAPLDGKGGHGEEISQEFFVKYNPGVLFVLDRAKVVGQKQAPALNVLNNGLVASTDAAKNKKIVEIDGFSWYIATSAPSSWRQMVKDVRASL